MKCQKSIKRRFLLELRLKKAKWLLILFFCLLLIAGGPSIVWAEDKDDPIEQAGLGVGSVLLTLPYGPAKIVYAGLGGIVGGATWILTGGNTETAQTVWDPSFYGDYVITPDHLVGKKSLRFFGVAPYLEEAYEDPYAD